MKCPSCSAENPDGKEFCGDCGAKLPEATPQPARSVAAAPPPTPPAPPVVASPPPNEYAAHLQEEAVTETKSKKLLVGIIAGLVALALLGGGAALLLTRKDEPREDPKTERGGGRGEGPEIKTEKGFESSLAALEDAGIQYYGDEEFWYYPVTEEDERAEYWIGPSDGDWQRGVIVEVRDDEWFVVDTYSVSPEDVKPEDPESPDVTPEEAAAWSLNEFIMAMYEGRYEDMMAVTTSPMSDYAVEDIIAVFAPADMTAFEITGAEVYDDGSAIVLFTLGYSDGTSYEIGAVCMLGNDGYYYVSDIGELESEQSE